MQDPMQWALPLYRAKGILVKVHLFFFLITIPLFLRLLHESQGVHWLDLFMLTVGLVFLIVLAHEYGHCFAARAVGGSADQILLWPLGGLAYCDVPHTPRANFWCTLWGPLVNFWLCLGCAAAMSLAGFSPVQALNPFANPLLTNTYNMETGRTCTSNYDYRFYKAGTAEALSYFQVVQDNGVFLMREAPNTQVDRALAPAWVVWTWRTCWLSWWLFLFNMLIPAYPMDAGRLLHCYLWKRLNYNRATVLCCYTGYVVGVILLMISIFANEVLLVGIGIFILINCYRTLKLESEGENSFGYDFSQGYTSLEKDDAPPEQPRRPGFLTRWKQERQMRKLKEEHDQRAAEDARMDELLEKIARHGGKHALTDEERRFMERVSARYRNRS